MFLILLQFVCLQSGDVDVVELPVALVLFCFCRVGLSLSRDSCALGFCKLRFGLLQLHNELRFLPVFTI